MTKPLFIAALALCLAHSIQAEAQIRIGVLPPSVEGELDVAAAAGFEAVLVERMTGDASELIPSADLARRAGTTRDHLSSCASGECMQRIATGAGIDGVVRVSIQASLNMYSMQIEVIGADGQQLASVEESCDLCSLAEARETLGRAAAAIGRDLPSGGVIRLDLTPASASVTIDDEAVTGIEINVNPGSHRVRASAEGYVSQERAVQVSIGEEVTVDLVLERDTDTDPPEVARPPSEGLGPLGISGVVLAAAGGLALAAGIALIVIDENCAEGRIDASGQCEFIYSTLRGGAVLAAIGGVSLVTGVVLIIIDWLRRRDTASTERQGYLSPLLGVGLDGTPLLGGSWRLHF